MRRRHGDRRTRPRFEVVGDLWGTVETTLRLPLRNVASNGVLIESAVRLDVGSVHRLSWEVGGQEISTDVRVRHVTKVTGADREPLYLVGAEFLAPNPALRQHLEQWLPQVLAETEASGV